MRIVLNIIVYLICFSVGLRMGRKRGFAAIMMRIWFMDRDAHNRIVSEIEHVLSDRGVVVDKQLIHNLTHADLRKSDAEKSQQEKSDKEE